MSEIPACRTGAEIEADNAALKSEVEQLKEQTTWAVNRVAEVVNERNSARAEVERLMAENRAILKDRYHTCLPEIEAALEAAERYFTALQSLSLEACRARDQVRAALSSLRSKQKGEGPWLHDEGDCEVYIPDPEAPRGYRDRVCVADVEGPDALFIAAARTAVPMLLARVKELEAEVRRLEDMLEPPITELKRIAALETALRLISAIPAFPSKDIADRALGTEPEWEPKAKQEWDAKRAALKGATE